MSRGRPPASAHARLERAREALARAKASGGRTDPWRVAELQLAHDRALDAALDAGDVDASYEAPAPRRAEPELSLAWVDESGRPRRGGGAS